MTRKLGRSGIQVGDIGVGTWVLGGPFHAGGKPLGWGKVDDDESVRVLHRAVELGANLIDTADVYGAGHAERVIGRAFRGRRGDVVIATKWGNTFDETTKEMGQADTSPEYVRTAVEASLRRLDTDYLDVLQLHVGLEPEEIGDLVTACDELVDEGKIRAYGWSTDETKLAEAFASAGRASVIQHQLNVLDDAPEMLALCDRRDLASLNRSPLAMGLLSDRINADTQLAGDDIRVQDPAWLRWFTDGRPDPGFLARRDAIREILCSGGRSLVQGALAWNLARSPRTIPIPGCRTLAQVEENLGTLSRPALTAQELKEIAALDVG